MANVYYGTIFEQPSPAGDGWPRPPCWP